MNEQNKIPVCVPTVQLLLPIKDIWGTPAEHRATAPFLLDFYLDPATDPAEVCAAAVWVHADGQPWNSPEMSELFDHVGTWLRAVTALLGGEKSAPIWAWEESGMRATRDGEFMILEERTHHVRAQLPPVRFDLNQFASQLLDATRAGAELDRELVQLAEARYPVEWQAVVAETPFPPHPAMYEFTDRILYATGRELSRIIDEARKKWEQLREADPEGLARWERARHVQNTLETIHGGSLSAEWNRLSSALDSMPADR